MPAPYHTCASVALPKGGRSDPPSRGAPRPEHARRRGALGREPRLRLSVVAVALLARVQAVAVGLELDATELDIVLLRGRISYDAVGWEEVRDAVAGWLRPAGAPPKLSPRKRPR